MPHKWIMNFGKLTNKLAILVCWKHEDGFNFEIQCNWYLELKRANIKCCQVDDDETKNWETKRDIARGEMNTFQT